MQSSSQTHADQALRLLEDPTDDERRMLGAFEYTTNEAVLHTDSSRLPKTYAARASCNYRVGNGRKPTMTYYLNRLQTLDDDPDWCLTLNGNISEEHVIDRGVFEHPLYTVESVAAQRRLLSRSGVRRTWFAGAYHGNGLHEDGLASGIGAAESIGVAW